MDTEGKFYTKEHALQYYMDKNNHPDLYFLDKDKYLLKDIRRQKKDSKNWDEEKGFNDVVSFLTLTPSISKNKVVCLDITRELIFVPLDTFPSNTPVLKFKITSSTRFINFSTSFKSMLLFNSFFI